MNNNEKLFLKERVHGNKKLTTPEIDGINMIINDHAHPLDEKAMQLLAHALLVLDNPKPSSNDAVGLAHNVIRSLVFPACGWDI